MCDTSLYGNVESDVTDDGVTGSGISDTLGIQATTPNLLSLSLCALTGKVDTAASGIGRWHGQHKKKQKAKP